jgi:glucokinase
MNRTQRYIGIDFGGTSIVAARFSDEGLLERTAFPTGADRGPEEILDTLYQAILEVFTDQVKAIGIGIPGIMDHQTGEILLINNIPGIKGVRVREKVADRFGLPVFQTNDANCFTLGEAYYGTAREFRNLVGITLGTGLGGGIIIERKIHTGLSNGAGELGCLPFRDGIVEDYCSGTWLEKTRGKSGAVLYKEARQGNMDAVRTFEELARNTGELLRYMMFVLAPEAFVIGGSVAGAWEFLERPMREEVDRFPVQWIRERVSLVPASLDNAGLYGAAALCISQM